MGRSGAVVSVVVGCPAASHLEEPVVGYGVGVNEDDGRTGRGDGKRDEVW